MSIELAPTFSGAPARRWKPYPAYKDSGVEWLGEVPEHWDIWKIGHGFRRIGSGTTPATNDMSFYEGDIPWVTTSELRENIITDTVSKLTERALKEHSALSLYSPGTLLVAMYGATIGRLGILGITACTNQACCAFAEPIALDTKFTFYWLLARRQEIIMVSSGGGQPNINQEKLRALRIPAPPLPEQRAITSFLDRQTAHLDALISRKERLIALLEEKRSALISSAVTKGLDPNAPMKDSEVDWLGEVPEHWKVKRLKYIAPVSNKKLTEKPEELLYLGLEQVESKTGHLLLDVMVENVESVVNVFNKGDVLFGKLRPYLAKVVYADFQGVCTSELLVLNPDSSLEGMFLFYRLISDDFINLINSMTYGTKMPRASSDQISNISVPLPPLPEQRAIASFLDRETARIDTLISKVREGIEKLREYRTALISAAVTGKIDVREVV